MALGYLFDPNKQFQDLNGVNNVAGFLRVYYEGTDDRATTYKNFIGALNPADIPIDNYGRAVVIVEDEKTYRLEVYSRNGNLMWTQHPLCALVGGGGSFEQVQSNWNEEDPTSAAFIKNKPDIDNFLEKDGDGKDVTVTFNEASERTNIGTGEKLSVLFGKIKKWLSDLKAVAFSGSYNDLSDKPSIPAAQVQSDWSQTNSQAVDYIKNKPSIPAAQVNSDWNANSGVAQILNKPNLASVATSGSYNDLSGKPTIPAAQVNSDWNANSGVAQILHKPSLGSLASKNSVTSSDVEGGSYNIDITGTSKYLEAINAGTSGDFDTLVPDTTRKCVTYGINGTFTNGPSGSSSSDYWGILLVYRRITSVNIPYQVFVSSAGDFLTRYSTTYDSTLGKYINWTAWTKIRNVSYASKIGTASTHPAIGSTSTPVYVNNDGNVTPCSLATVASTGSYNDLSNKPTIPAVKTTTNVYIGYQVDTSSAVSKITVNSYQFINSREYHLFIALKSSIDLSSYTKATVKLRFYIGATNYNSSPWKMTSVIQVDNGTAKLNTGIMPFNWLAEGITPELYEIENFLHIDFVDVDDDSVVYMTSGQYINVVIRGTETY